MQADANEILNKVNDAVIAFNKNGDILYSNKAFSVILGLTQEQLIGKNIWKLRPRLLESLLYKKVMEAIDKKENRVVEWQSPYSNNCWETKIFPSVKGVTAIGRDITERKRDEEDYKMTSAVFDMSSDSIIVADLDGNIKKFNNAACKMRGYAKEELAKLKVQDLNAPESAELLEYRFKHLVEQGSAFFEAYHLRKDKSLIPVEIHASVIKWRNKQLIVAIHRDITERKKAEETLRENEKLYRTLFDNSEDGFILLEPIFDKNGTACDFRFLKFNSAFERQTNAKAEDAIGKLSTLVTPALEGEITQLSGRVSKTGKSIHNEAFNKYSNKWFDSFYFPYSEGKVGILFRDITERVKAEKALRESEERYRQLFNSMTETFFVAELLHDKNGKVVDFVYCEANPEYVKSLGKTSEQVIGKRAKELFGGVGIEESWLEELNKITKTGKALRGEQFSKRTGRFYEVHAWRVSDNRAGVITYDISQQKALEKKLQDSERLAAIGQTAGMIGHDIRNPLQAIVSELYIAKEVMAESSEGKGKQEGLDSISFVEEQVNYINKIVADLQDYARTLNPEYAIVDLADLIASVFDTIVLPNNVELEVDVKDKLQLKTDATFVKRAITNLVNNAIQAMPQGGRLGLTLYREENWVVVTVSDTGQGIPESVKANLFKPLMTTKAKGQGLGLAVVKRLIEGLNGAVSFESEEGKGTKFIIKLPKIE